jgi:hypothetical protein
MSRATSSPTEPLSSFYLDEDVRRGEAELRVSSVWRRDRHGVDKAEKDARRCSMVFVCASTSWERRKARGGSGGGTAGQEEVGELGLQG